MAGSQTSEQDTAKAVQQYAGEDFLRTTAHVSREQKGGKQGQKQVLSIEGGRLVSELKNDEKLTDEERESLTAQGAIVPATPDDIKNARARASAREAAAAEGERRRAFAQLDAEQSGERQAIIEKHNAARDKELAALGEKQTDARAKLEKKFAPSDSKK